MTTGRINQVAFLHDVAARMHANAVRHWSNTGSERHSFEQWAKATRFEGLIMPPNALHPRERAPTTRPAMTTEDVKAERDAGYRVRCPPKDGCRQKGANGTRRFHRVRYRCKNRSIVTARTQALFGARQ